LRERGILVPDANLRDTREVAGHQVWYFEQPGAQPKKHAAALAGSIESLFAAPDVRQVLISAENLSNHDNLAYRWFKEVASQIQTEVIVYLRRQDDFLLSSWQQWYAKVYPDFWAWLTSCVGIVGDWRIPLKHWESIVGRERLHVRLYERDRLVGGDVVADFVQFLQTGEAPPDDARNKMVNESFNEAIVALIPGSGLFADGHDVEFYRFLSEVLGPACVKRPHESSITYDQRIAILERYEDCNVWIRDRYFAESHVPATLFELPTPHDYRVPSERELTREQIQILARLVFDLRKNQSGATEA
jgi:hypothetical protein